MGDALKGLLLRTRRPINQSSSDPDAQQSLLDAECALLPYPRHPGIDGVYLMINYAWLKESALPT